MEFFLIISLVIVLIFAYKSKTCKKCKKFIWAFEFGWVKKIAFTGKLFRIFLSSFLPLASIIISILDKQKPARVPK